MSWLTKNVGSLSNLASRIAAETNGDPNEATQQLQQQLMETREELFARHQEWEQAKQNYESRLQNLTNGDATAQKVEQLEQKLNRAVGLLKNLQGEKQNLSLKVKALEDEKGEALAQVEAAKEIQHHLEQQIQRQQQKQQEQEQQEQQSGQASPTSDHAGREAEEKIQQLEQELKAKKEQHISLVQELNVEKEQHTSLVQELKAEKEQNSSLVQDLKSQLQEAVEINKKLEGQLTQQHEESDDQVDISIELNMAKDDLEQALAEIESLKETNAKLFAKSKAPPMPPTQSQSPALIKELAEAKATIAQLESRLSKESEVAMESVALKATQKELQETVETMCKDLTQANTLHSEAQKELSEYKATRAALEKKEATMAKSIARLESELAAAKTTTEGDAPTNGDHNLSEELQSRIQDLEQQLETSKEEFSDEQIEAVVLTIQALLGPSRTDALPQSLVNDKVLATWNRAKDEVDSYKDGNRSLEDNLSRLRRENQEAQAKHSAELESLESEKAKQLDSLRKSHEQAIIELEQRLQSDSSNKDDLSAQINAIKLSAEESRKMLQEQFDAEKKQLIAKEETLKEEYKIMKQTFEEELLAAETSQRERDATIQKLQATVTSNEQLLASIKEDLQKTTNERNHFQTQHRALLDRVSNMKSTLGTKLQADMDNINTLKQQIDQLTAQNNDYLLTIKQLEEELMASHEHYEKTSRELEHLRRRLVDIQEDASAEVVEKENLIHELQSRLQREEREREDWETMASEQRASKDHAVVNMRAMERERDAARAEKESIRLELDREIESLNNLQSVLEEFQSAKESEIQFALEGLHRQLNQSNASLEEFQHRALAAEEQLQNLTLDVERAYQLEREVKEKNLTIGKLRHDAVIQQGHLTEAMRRLREENSQNTVDIPLISNLFISFLNIPRGDQKRFEILQLISGVLKFTDEQREQAGLIRKAGVGFGVMTPSASGSRSPSMEQMRQPPPEPRESFIDMWTSFLIRESSANSSSNTRGNTNNNNNNTTSSSSSSNTNPRSP